MRFITQALAVFTLAVVASTAGASVVNPVNTVDYRTLDTAQPTESGNKVEVTEFFWYSCPHCNAFDPALTAWVKAQGGKIVFKRVPVAFRPSEEVLQRLYYALESMDKLGEMHAKIFHAIHVEHKQLHEEDQIADFVASQGIDRAKFLEAFNSFGVQTKTQRAARLTDMYKIDGVPMIAIDGRYETSPSLTSGSMGGEQPESELFPATLRIMDWLVAKAAKEHKH